ncbi:leucine-rich repeat neuronal protein 3-like [Ischnura elegans]|uniref:leucine-rich repeat neuronal protein 3-like n=1 Tax=Ischnura elegans TaxID=197161 RepID=UPI001ED89787|nr:leucine-rich repeat neuronal protein 3-like [Ischnura elegans]
MRRRIASTALLLALIFGFANADKICDDCKCEDSEDKDGKFVTSTWIECRNNENFHKSYQNANYWPYQISSGNKTQPTVVIDVSVSDDTDLTRLRPFPAVPITRLALHSNHISSVDDDAFSSLADILEVIDLSDNRLTSSLKPEAFRGTYDNTSYQPLHKLRVLKLMRNAFHSLNADLFEHLPALEELYLDQNPFRVIDSVTVKAICTIPKLKLLSLSRTSIQMLPDGFLHTPRFLEILDISHNNLREVPATVADARELKTLILDGNPITSFHNRSMPPLRGLSTLSISHMPYLTTIEDGAFTQLTGLQELNCQLNPKLAVIETYAIAESFESRSINNFTVLYLNNNGLTHLSRHMVYDWSKLNKIDLHGNPWSCDCVNQWMVRDLVPILDGIDPMKSKAMWCHHPPELVGKSMFDLSINSYHLRCLDLYGNRPENDGAMLIGVLIGTLLAIPICGLLYLAWAKRAWLLSFCLPGIPASVKAGRGAADYSRAFYQRTSLSTVSNEF